MGTPGDADIMTAAAEREFGGDAGGGGGNGDVGSSTGTYTVQKGDTLGRIAAKFGTTWQNLAKMNGISNPDNINVGQVLKVTGGGATRTYTVVIGDTLAKIAAKFGTTWPALAALNGINNPDDIAVGQVLKLEIVEVPPDRRDVYRSAVDHAVEASGVLYGWGSEAVTRAKRICYRTVWAETDWRNLANPSVPESLLMTPNDGNGFDMNSTGLYQQRLPWWGSVLGSMNPETATTRFLEHMVSEVADWLGRDEPDVCQRVQRSQFDGETINSKTGQPYPYAQNYKDRQAQTDALAADLAYFTNLST